ncbi:MAG: glycoside hydrolase family 65 protein, partial [Actinobacteria bacterium]|nr:glycoside hydrolase family 65 protein [Actinomycetota bacterium]
YPWRTIRGEECSGYWPAGTAAVHVNAAVAAAAARHVWWTRDVEFEQRCALPILVHTARFWVGFGYDGADGRFHIDGVTGPDEYTAVVDDNVYTNLMARQNLLAAAAACERWPEVAAELGVDPEETNRWSDCAARVAVPYDERLEVHQQDLGFTSRGPWDFERSARDGEYPLLEHAPYFDLYRRQVVKQADLVLALHWAGDQFEPAQKARNFAYYEPLTVRDSSLSACTQAVIAAEVGHLDLAAEYLADAALMDLDDLEHNARDGLHIASLAGSWLALVAGFGGMRDMGAHLLFRPQLPPGWHRLRFKVRLGACRLSVHISPRQVSYQVMGEQGMTIVHCSGDSEELVELEPDTPVRRSWQPVKPLTPRPHQPPGREPARELTRR